VDNKLGWNHYWGAGLTTGGMIFYELLYEMITFARHWRGIMTVRKQPR